MFVQSPDVFNNHTFFHLCTTLTISCTALPNSLYKCRAFFFTLYLLGIFTGFTLRSTLVWLLPTLRQVTLQWLMSVQAAWQPLPLLPPLPQQSLVLLPPALLIISPIWPYLTWGQRCELHSCPLIDFYRERFKFPVFVRMFEGTFSLLGNITTLPLKSLQSL